VKHARHAPATARGAPIPNSLTARARSAQVALAMADLDAELLDRVARWCAEAGRTAGAREIRRALSALGWDELLAVRALLADPPPARPLGPHALADIARGTPADVAAEREREGRYAPEEGEDAPPPAPPASPPPPRPTRRSPAKARPSLVIRRARDREPAPSHAPEGRAPLEALLRPEGRAELERLVRRLGARRRALAAALAERWQRPGGAPPGEDDVAALLDHHGLARAFERRERDELLHALRAAGGLRGAAATRLGLDAAGLEAALVRLDAAAEAERIREQRRADLRARATLSERVALLLSHEERLRDLGLLDEFDADLRERLPEHVRALRASAAPLRQAFAASLSLPPPVADALAARFGLELGPRLQAPRRGPSRPSSTGARRSSPRGAASPGPRGEPRSPRPRAQGDRRGPARQGAPGARGGAPPPRPRGAASPARRRPGARPAGGRGPRGGRGPQGR
jgi:hypothetical protein